MVDWRNSIIVMHLSISADVFSDEPLPKADLYIVGHFIHMFNDDVTASILKRIRQFIRPGNKPTFFVSFLLFGHPTHSIIEIAMDRRFFSCSLNIIISKNMPTTVYAHISVVSN